MQVDLSEKESGIACANSQLHKEHERYLMLQNKAEAESNEAAAAAATQMQQSEKLVQQLQAQLDAAQLHGQGLQSMRDILSKKNEDLTAELSGSKASAESLQVSFITLAANAATLQATTVCTSDLVTLRIPLYNPSPLLHLLVCTVSMRTVISGPCLAKVGTFEAFCELYLRLTDAFVIAFVICMQASLQQHKSDSEQQVAAHNSELESVQSELQQRKVAGKQLQEAANAMAAEKEKLELQLSAVSAKAHELSTHLSTAKTQLKQSATSHSKLSQQFKDTQQQLAASQADADATQQKLVAKTASVTKMEGELSTANTQLAQSATAHSELSQQLKDSQQQLAASQDGAYATRQELAVQTAVVTSLQTQLQDSALAQQGLQAQVDAASAVEQQLQQQLQDKDEADQQLQKQLEQRGEAHQLLQQQLQDQNEAYQQLQQQQQEKVEAQQQLQQQLMSVRSSQAALQAQVQQYEAQVARLEGDKGVQFDQIVTLKEQRRHQQAAFQQLQTQLEAKDSALATEAEHHTQVNFMNGTLWLHYTNIFSV